MSVLSHALLGVSALALLDGGLRLGSACVERGLERVLATVSFAAAGAVAEAVLLGAFGLGTEPVALLAGSLGLWMVARVLTERPAVRPSDELREWVASAPGPALAAAGALAGIGVAWTVWSLDAAYVGIDGIYYHLPEINHWIHDGAPGSVDRVNYLYLVGNYPLVNEVLLAWAMGLSRSMAPLSVWPVTAMTMLVVASWTTLRALGVAAPYRALSTAAVALIPVGVDQLIGPFNDLPALAWLACAGALCVSAAKRQDPRLLVPGLVAAGLAAGTKTTALPLAAMAVLAAGYSCRGRLRPFARPLVLAGLVAVGVGGFWYLRDLFTHGSPFWPWAAAPWGDPMPEFLERTYPSLLERPRATLEGRLDDYASRVGGGALLVAAAMLVALIARTRAALALAAGVAGLCVLWAAAPSTAITDEQAFDGSVSQTRYLLPMFGLAAVALALATRDPGWQRRLAAAALAGSVAWSLAQIVTGDFPDAAPAWALIAAAGLGAGGATTLPRFGLPGRAALLSILLAAVVLLAIPANGFVRRHAEAGRFFDEPLVGFLSERPGFEDGEDTVAMAPVLAGTLAGDRLQHDVVLIPAASRCDEVAARRRDGWVILRHDSLLAEEIGYRAGDCLRGVDPLAVVDRWRIYPPLGSGGH